jgi:hypothetical protein
MPYNSLAGIVTQNTLLFLLTRKENVHECVLNLGLLLRSQDKIIHENIASRVFLLGAPRITLADSLVYRTIYKLADCAAASQKLLSR